MKTQFYNALSSRLPFVLYRKPNEKLVNGWFQKTNALHTATNLTKSCFVFAPFSGNEQVVFYADQCTLHQEEIANTTPLSDTSISLENVQVDKTFHLNLVQKGIEFIKQKKANKIVLSRKEEVHVDENHYEAYFNRFLQKYPTAFVYWWYHPKVGMWMGATPEQLVKIDGLKLQTVALAGTMVNNAATDRELIWGTKEKNEQKIVTEFIVDTLKKFTSNIQQSQPYTFKAGALLHIKTDVEALLRDENDAFHVVQALHPTPALCGYPKNAAKEFIIYNEGYDREYYGGYLGEWKFDNLHYGNKSDLYVNLRCMKLEGSKAYLFLGGGINKDSDPESEYYETVNKSKTVKSIL